MCLPIGSMLLRSKILWMKHVVFWREPDGVIPRATGDWLTGRWDSRKVLRHCHNTWKTSTYARRCWSSRFWHSDWKSGLFPDFYRKYSKVRTFPGPGGQQLKIRTFPGNKDPWEPCILCVTALKNVHNRSTTIAVRKINKRYLKSVQTLNIKYVCVPVVGLVKLGIEYILFFKDRPNCQFFIEIIFFSTQIHSTPIDARPQQL